MTNKIFMDEKKQAVKIYTKGFTNGEFSFSEALLVAKYIRQNFNYGDDRTKTKLIDFCEKHDRFFNYIMVRAVIQKIVKNSLRELSSDTEPIFISQSELDAIRKVKNFTGQKLLFAFLVYSKKSKGYVYRDILPDIKKSANLKISNNEIGQFAYMFYKAGLIRDSNENWFLKFLDEGKFSPVLKISNFKDLSKLTDIYKKYCGGELGYCADCEAEFIRTGRTHYFCADCSKKKELYRDRERKRRKS